METVIEPIPEQPIIDAGKLNEVREEIASNEENVIHKSNGVAESGTGSVVQTEQDSSNTLIEGNDVNDVSSITEDLKEVTTESVSDIDNSISENITLDLEENLPINETLENPVENNEIIKLEPENGNKPIQTSQINNIEIEEIPEESGNVESFCNESLRFETEILVETNDINEIELTESKNEDNDNTSNILGELDQSIELSEALRTDVTENLENNNCTVGQEVFNKEELLDILEGNDDQASDQQVSKLVQYADEKALETKLALQQLSRLKGRKRRNSTLRKKILIKKTEKVKIVKEKIIKDENIKQDIPKEVIQQEKIHREESIVNALVKDWEDEECVEQLKPKEKESSTKTNEKNDNNSEVEKRTSVDSSTSEGQTTVLNKINEGPQPQRRLGRVIKKKVIFDPDNPDTFTKGKVYNKNIQSEKDQPPIKKIKVEPTTPRAKSPVSKMQWKKPSPKNSKQAKRLTEVDKLLMDEGAVNMIYQLTPEAPKGKKNMRTKAEFIKKIQSSTPESKEMKFRERKKELSKEDGDPKKILSGKHRSSLGSSVKSPSVCEDFETHSADDSIIYRRHSSSSYSSSCMSPRRLSDVDSGANHSVVSSSHHTTERKSSVEQEEGDGVAFVYDVPKCNEIINKDDCLTIKKKLNSKLSLALNKRKRDTSKPDKSTKKHIKTENAQEKHADCYKYVSVSFDERVAIISIEKTGSKYNLEILKEMSEVLAYIDTRNDISTTLLTSECGTLCSDLDLKQLLDTDVQKRSKIARHVASLVRSLVFTVAQHSKLLCSGVWSTCSEVALVLVALSDVTFATENATFSMSNQACAAGPLFSGLSSIITTCQPLSQSLINDLVIFDRSLSASEAVQSGLVSKVLWTSGFSEQLQAIVKDIASQPIQMILLKKKLLNVRKSPENTFLAQLETVRDLMVEYWTSDEGQDVIRALSQDAQVSS